MSFLKESKTSLRITLTYVLSGGLWIFITDVFILKSVDDGDFLLTNQTLKGWFFVSVTGILLFFILNKYERRIKKQLRALRQAQNDLMQFFYKASHDLRGPVATILGITGRETRSNGSFEMQAIRDTAEKADAVIHELVRLAAIYDHRVQVSEIRTEDFAREFLLECMDGVASFDQREFTIQCRSESIYSDSFLLKVLLKEVVANAFIYRKPGNKSHSVELYCGPRGKSKIEIKVRDTGIGMSEEVREQIFNMFYKGTAHYHSHGLGLYKTRVIAERIDGMLEVESERGIGTTMRIILPAKGIPA